MASTGGDLRNREIKLFKADGSQFVQRNDKLQGTKAVEPNNVTSPHEVEVPSLDRLDLNENSNGVIEDLSDAKILQCTAGASAQQSKPYDGNAHPVSAVRYMGSAINIWIIQSSSLHMGRACTRPCTEESPLQTDAWLRKLLYGEGKRRRTMKWKSFPPPDADFSSLLEGLIDPPEEAV